MLVANVIVLYIRGKIFKKVKLFGFKQKYRGEKGYVENYPFGSPSERGLEKEEEFGISRSCSAAFVCFLKEYGLKPG